MRKLKVLVTCGPTWVAIDQVRVISNTSTGVMGHAIADAFLAEGCDVTVLEGAVTDHWKNPKAKVVKYWFFDELSAGLKKLLNNKYDVIVHAAAVSDFLVEKPSAQKLDSSRSLMLKLEPAPKLIELIKKLSPTSFLVGFKLESTMGMAIQEAKKLLAQLGCDVVVANTSGVKYSAVILDRRVRVVARGSDKKILAQQLAEAVRFHLGLMKK